MTPQDFGRTMQSRVDAVAAAILPEIAQAQIINIRARCRKGLGVTDQPMPPYPRGYALVKGKRQPRDLLVTGRMLASLHITRAQRSVRVAFADAASRQKALDNQKRARWFGVSPRDRASLTALARRLFTQAMRRPR